MGIFASPSIIAATGTDLLGPAELSHLVLSKTNEFGKYNLYHEPASVPDQ